MGGCFSVSLPCDQIVNQVSQCLKGSYTHNLPENLESLEKAMEMLKAKRDDVQTRVDREEFTRRQRRLAKVDLWFKNVLTIDNQVSDLLCTSEIELQRLCLCRFCSKNFKKSYRYGKRVMKKLKDVEDLDSQGSTFDVVTETVSVVQVWSRNNNIEEIPEEISELVSLRYLDLSGTKIQGLPLGLQELKMLIHLNLENTTKLENLDRVSNLSSLRIIRLRSSNIMLNVRLMKEFELLEHLEYITINISPTIVGEKWLCDSRVMRCIQSVKIIELRDEESERILVLPAGFVNLREVFIESCGMLEIKTEKIRLDKSLTSPSFPTTLSSLYLYKCNGLKDLTWLMFAPNLTRLGVIDSKEVESIISEEKAANVLDKEKPFITLLFRKLQVLLLSGLPEVKSICWTSLSFPCLKRIDIYYCPKLRKLPLNSQSVIKVEELVIRYSNDEEWKESVEWEDDATRLRFLHSFK